MSANGTTTAPWPETTLSNLICGKLQNGAFIQKPEKGSGLLFANVVDMYGSVHLDYQGLERLNVKETDIERYKLNEGDVLVVRSSLKRDGIGQSCIATNLPESVFYDCHLIRVVPDKTKVFPEFLSFYWRSPVGKQDLINRSKTTTMTTLNQEGLSGALVPLPPLSEQKKIAHILSTVQRAIEAQERIIQTTTELKKALMHKLFTEGLRHERQKQTEIGPVPESWKVVKLGEIAKIERGKFSHRPRNEPRFYGGEYPFVQTGDVSNCDGYVRSYTQTLNEAGLAISKMFPAGIILITIAANIGFTGILEFDSACPDSLIGITPYENVHTEFLNYYLITQQSEMDRLAPKNTQKNINIQFLKPWPVPLPSIDEQTEMAGAFSATDRKIRLATQKRSQLQDLFRTLLHELMTAKTRVHELEFST